jgi:hypothetical protein
VTGALLLLLLSGPAFAQNTPPTDIALDSTNVDENQQVGTAVGNFSTTDGDAGDSFTYSLVNGRNEEQLQHPHTDRRRRWRYVR